MAAIRTGLVIDGDGVVQQVIIADYDFIQSGAAGEPANWIRTSYVSGFRGVYAGPGYRYDAVADIFIPPRPFLSWSWDADAAEWLPPTERPAGEGWVWYEPGQQWLALASPGPGHFLKG